MNRRGLHPHVDGPLEGGRKVEVALSLLVRALTLDVISPVYPFVALLGDC